MVSPFPPLLSVPAAVLAVVTWWPDAEPAYPQLARSAATVAPASVQDPGGVRTDDRPGRALKITKSSDGLFYVSALVNGTRVRFLVDTGANLAVLTREDARRVGVLGGGARAAGRIDTAAGATTMQRVTLSRVSVAGKDMADIDAAVMGGGLKVSLLGQNMLSRIGPVTISGDEISLGAKT